MRGEIHPHIYIEGWSCRGSNIRIANVWVVDFRRILSEKTQAESFQVRPVIIESVQMESHLSSPRRGKKVGRSPLSTEITCQCWFLHLEVPELSILQNNRQSGIDIDNDGWSGYSRSILHLLNKLISEHQPIYGGNHLLRWIASGDPIRRTITGCHPRLHRLVRDLDLYSKERTTLGMFAYEYVARETNCKC